MCSTKNIAAAVAVVASANKVVAQRTNK